MSGISSVIAIPKSKWMYRVADAWKSFIIKVTRVG